jgi:hypothetical protein
VVQDVPDIKGDKLNNIKSFSVRAGAPRMFKVRPPVRQSVSQSVRSAPTRPTARNRRDACLPACLATCSIFDTFLPLPTPEQLGKRLMIGLFLGASLLCLGAAQHAFAAAGGLAALSSLAAGAAAAAGAGAGGTVGVWPFVTAGARAVIAGLALLSAREVQRRAGEVDPQDGKQVYDYYMFLWRLFYLSYLALPLAR